MSFRRTRLFFVLLIMLGSCAPATEAGVPEKADEPRLRVLIHDKPTIDVDEVWLTFDRVSAHHEGEGWLDVSNEETTIELLSLQDGVVAELGLNTLPPGDYSQIRLHLVDSWVVGGQGAAPLDVPSGSTSGLKIGHDFTLPECGTLTINHTRLGCRGAPHSHREWEVQASPCDRYGERGARAGKLRMSRRLWSRC